MLINDVASQDLSNVSSVVSSSVFIVKEATHDAPITNPVSKRAECTMISKSYTPKTLGVNAVKVMWCLVQTAMTEGHMTQFGGSYW